MLPSGSADAAVTAPAASAPAVIADVAAAASSNKKFMLLTVLLMADLLLADGLEMSTSYQWWVIGGLTSSMLDHLWPIIAPPSSVSMKDPPSFPVQHPANTTKTWHHHSYKNTFYYTVK